MKYLIFTDIHGSKKYLDMALEKFAKFNCDKMIILGDFLYHGPRNPLPDGYDPKACYEELNKHKDIILAIKGNCDADIDEMVLEFPLFKEAIKQLGNRNILFTHGDEMEEVEYDGTIMVGHYHKSEIVDNIIYLGSLSMPKDTHHAFAIADQDNLIAYDLMTEEKLFEFSLR